jgi:hypothetical protein
MMILQLKTMILDERTSSYSFLRLLVKGQDHSFFKDLTGVICTVDGTLVKQVPKHLATGLYISQLIRYARAYFAHENFPKRAKLLTKKLMLQGYYESCLE